MRTLLLTSGGRLCSYCCPVFSEKWRGRAISFYVMLSAHRFRRCYSSSKEWISCALLREVSRQEIDFKGFLVGLSMKTKERTGRFAAALASSFDLLPSSDYQKSFAHRSSLQRTDDAWSRTARGLNGAIVAFGKRNERR